jgi:hypothetical protein
LLNHPSKYLGGNPHLHGFQSHQLSSKHPVIFATIRICPLCTSAVGWMACTSHVRYRPRPLCVLCDCLCSGGEAVAINDNNNEWSSPVKEVGLGCSINVIDAGVNLDRVSPRINLSHTTKSIVELICYQLCSVGTTDNETWSDRPKYTNILLLVQKIGSPLSVNPFSTEPRLQILLFVTCANTGHSMRLDDTRNQHEFWIRSR